jgi:hypothetical protein
MKRAKNLEKEAENETLVEDDWITTHNDIKTKEKDSEEIEEIVDNSKKEEKKEQTLPTKPQKTEKKESDSEDSSEEEEDDEDTEEITEGILSSVQVEDVATVKISEKKKEEKKLSNKNVKNCRTYDISITYDNHYRTPRLVIYFKI